MKFIVIKKNVLTKVVAMSLTLCLCLCAVAMTGSAAVWQNKTPRKLPIYSVETEEKAVALSFDASWGADKTLGILEVLSKYDVKANYFVVGFWAEKYAEELKTLSDSGRVEIGTHSNTHPNLPKLSSEGISNELKTSIATIENITKKKIELFRPPFGDYNDVLITEAEKLGLYTIQWDVDSLDWKDLSAGEIAKRILAGAKEGSIILMHNDGKHTLDALPIVIEGLKNRGFTLKTIGELIYKEGFYIDHTGRQHKENI